MTQYGFSYTLVSKILFWPKMDVTKWPKKVTLAENGKVNFGQKRDRSFFVVKCYFVIGFVLS